MYGGKKVLIVDDSKLERHILREITEALNFEVFEAETGELGVQRALEIKPDLILMDVVMPGMNGYQATRKITTTDGLKNIPVIMCTSKSQTTDKICGQSQGASAYVVKPINKDELIGEIKKLV